MEEDYATITHVELKKNIYIPNEWPIQGIESLVLFLAEKIIMNRNPVTPILRVKEIPAKLIRCPTASGVIHIFKKVPPEEVDGAYLYDVVLPIDNQSIKVDLASGRNNCLEFWPNYCASASPRAKKMSYHVIPPRFNDSTCRSSNANDLALRRRVRSMRRLTSNHGILIFVFVILIPALTTLLLLIKQLTFRDVIQSIK